MWWDGMFSLLADLLDPKDPRKKDALWIFVILLILAVTVAYFLW